MFYSSKRQWRRQGWLVDMWNYETCAHHMHLAPVRSLPKHTIPQHTIPYQQLVIYMSDALPPPTITVTAVLGNTWVWGVLPSCSDVPISGAQTQFALYCMSLLMPAVSHFDDSGTQTHVHWVKVYCLSHWVTTAPWVAMALTSLCLIQLFHILPWLEDARWAWRKQVCGMWYFSPSVLWYCCLGDRKGHLVYKSWMLIWWWWRFYWSFARLAALVVITTCSIFGCINRKKPILAYAACPGKCPLNVYSCQCNIIP